MSAAEGFAEPGGQGKGRSPEAGANPPNAPRVHLAYLDGLRALAASYVVGFHAVLGFGGGDLTGPWGALRRAFAFGHEAVAVFIVLSGYCLMLPVVRSPGEKRAVALGSFMGRRAFRILPPYFAALAGSLALIALVGSLRTPHSGTIWDDSLPGLELGAIVSHVLVVHNWFPAWSYQINGPLWSVATEWQIYFLFPLVLLPMWRRFGPLATLGLAAVLGYSPLLFARASAAVAIPWYVLLFTFGMIAAAIGFSQAQPFAQLRSGVRWQLWCSAVWLGCVALAMGNGQFWFAHKPLADLLVGLATTTLLVYLTGRASSSERGRLLELLESRPLVGLGHFSYSLYLTHLPVLALVYFTLRPLGWPPSLLSLALLALGASASLGVAYLFHVAVERHFIVKR
jgi:peptidoglycan/LPS O-acetylase OafA/YrhL